MELEELLRDRRFEKGEQKLQKALEIAETEWGKIAQSLELAGDIGGFRKEDFMIGDIEEDVIIRAPLESPTKSVSVYAPSFYPMYFVENLLMMDQRFGERGYSTPEALYSYIELATKAVERLGLKGSFSMAFAVGYGYVRTGWLAEKGYPEERLIFSKMFFKGMSKRHDWDFYFTSAKQRLSEILSLFMEWQNDESLYRKDVKSKSRVKAMMV